MLRSSRRNLGTSPYAASSPLPGGMSQSPAAAKRHRAAGVAVVASGFVMRHSFSPYLSRTDREARMRSRFWIPCSGSMMRASCKGMYITIAGFTCRIVEDSGPTFARWWLGREISVSPPFPFPVDQGMSFTLTARPSAELSWSQLHMFRNRKLEAIRSNGLSLSMSLLVIGLGAFMRWYAAHQASYVDSGPMQVVVGTWSITQWMVLLWKGYSPAIINIQDPYFIRLSWVAFLALVTLALVAVGLRGVFLWAAANFFGQRNTEAQAALETQRSPGLPLPKPPVGDANSSLNTSRASIGRTMTSPTGNRFASTNQNFSTRRSPGHVQSPGWGGTAQSPYAPVSQSLMGTPGAFAQGQPTMTPIKNTVLGSPPPGNRMIQSPPSHSRGVTFASPIASARRMMGSPATPLQTSMSIGFMASPLRSPNPILPQERTTPFEEWCGKRRTRLEESTDMILRHVSPLQAAKSNFSNTSFSSFTNQSPQILNVSQVGGRSSFLSPMINNTSQLGDDHSALLLSREPVDRKFAWWMERPNGALIYFREMTADRSAHVDPLLLLSQCAHGIREWLAVQVLGYVSSLIAQVDHDAARGLHKESAATTAAQVTTAAAGAPAASSFSFAGGFGATPGGFGTTGAFGGAAGGFGAGAGGFGMGAAAAPQQDPAAAAELEVQAIRRVEALDRRLRVKDYTTMKRFPEPDKVAALGSKRVENYIRKRIKELAADKGLLKYVWDGGSSDYYDCDVMSSPNPHYDLQHSSFGAHRQNMPSASADSSRFWPADGRARMVWPQHDLGQGGAISISPRALPTDAELLMHLFVTFMDHKQRPPRLPEKPLPKTTATGVGMTSTFGAPAANPFGGVGTSALGGGFGAPAASTFSAAQPAAAAGGGVSQNLTPSLKATHWFTTEYYLAANPSERPRRPQRGGAQNIAHADVARNLKCKPFIEERLGHDPDCPQKMCPQYIVGISAKRAHGIPTMGHTESTSMPERTAVVEVQPGPDNVFQSIAVLAVEARLHYRGVLGNIDLSHPTLNMMSFIPFIP